MTLASFVPDDQADKIALIDNAAKTLDPALNAPSRPAPSDAENVRALKNAQAALMRAADNHSGEGPAAAKRLAADLGRLAAASPATRERAQAVFIDAAADRARGLAQRAASAAGERRDAAGLAASGNGSRPTAAPACRSMPKGDLSTNPAIRKFAQAVLEKAEPAATGGPIAILESGRTIIRAFYEAGLWALISIAILLWLTLRRIGDVLLTLIPLIVAGVVTLELCVAFGLALNFANIIALPLLLGIGVAFKIYYMMSWRAGYSQVLQSPLTRAVFFSALTTATAFGSLWFSNHPGTSSMGKLLALSLRLHAGRRRALPAGANGPAPRARPPMPAEAADRRRAARQSRAGERAAPRPGAPAAPPASRRPVLAAAEKCRARSPPHAARRRRAA